MCGIVGVFVAGESIPSKWILDMADCLKHRGPDDEGYLAANTRSRMVQPLVGDDSKVHGIPLETFQATADLVLGHRRLSILDTSPLGHQPMSDVCGDLWIVYNGEIYNYLELRAQLESLGYGFRSNTDTEVLLAAYREWGEDCLGLLNGMWAFVIYDRKQNILFGARDRFGVKPLYYYQSEERFAFASEIKAILRLPGIKGEINPAAVFDYLVLGFQETEEEGFLKNIIELQPSYAFRYDLVSRTLKKWQYYALEYNHDWHKFDESKLEYYTQNTKEHLERAITMRLRSDVPVGSCLSGGMDSSAIVCIINKLLGQHGFGQIGDRQKVFTAAYEGDRLDESRWAEIVVHRTKTSWHTTFPKPDEFLRDLEDLVFTQDVPFYSSNVYAQYRVMKLVRESGVKVLLDGQGGDEVFSGYHPYHAIFALEALKHGDVSRFIQEWRCVGNSPVSGSQLISRMIKVAGARLMPASVRRLAIKMIKGEAQYINPEFWDCHRERLDLADTKLFTSLNGILHDCMTGFNLKALLRHEDRNSMRFSVESRPPFADDVKLIECIFAIPSTYKIRNGWSKYLLRQAMKGIIPETIRTRTDKIGFATPERSWLCLGKNTLRDYIGEDLSPFIDVGKVLKAWDVLLSPKPVSQSGWSADIWRVINLAVWKRVYNL